jgi:hypothetical protein
MAQEFRRVSNQDYEYFCLSLKQISDRFDASIFVESSPAFCNIKINNQDVHRDIYKISEYFDYYVKEVNLGKRKVYILLKKYTSLYDFPAITIAETIDFIKNMDLITKKFTKSDNVFSLGKILISRMKGRLFPNPVIVKDLPVDIKLSLWEIAKMGYVNHICDTSITLNKVINLLYSDMYLKREKNHSNIYVKTTRFYDIKNILRGLYFKSVSKDFLSERIADKNTLGAFFLWKMNKNNYYIDDLYSDRMIKCINVDNMSSSEIVVVLQEMFGFSKIYKDGKIFLSINNVRLPALMFDIPKYVNQKLPMPVKKAFNLYEIESRMSDMSSKFNEKRDVEFDESKINNEIRYMNLKNKKFDIYNKIQNSGSISYELLNKNLSKKIVSNTYENIKLDNISVIEKELISSMLMSCFMARFSQTPMTKPPLFVRDFENCMFRSVSANGEIFISILMPGNTKGDKVLYQISIPIKT